MQYLQKHQCSSHHTANSYNCPRRSWCDQNKWNGGNALQDGFCSHGGRGTGGTMGRRKSSCGNGMEK
ncbi:hypothetical protein VTK56DRAFT_4826 [Thermocarpiscus australiensis]